MPVLPIFASFVFRPRMAVPRITLLAAFLALACAGPAAAGVSVASRDVPLVGSGAGRASADATRVLPAQTAPVRFHLVGLHWQGSGDVEFRTARIGGAWSAWRPARPETEDGPNAGDREARAKAGWELGNPWWTGPARRLQVRLSGRVTRLRAHYVTSPVREAPRAVEPAARTLAAAPPQPALVKRAAWGANESIVRGTPSYASRLSFAVVHHTAGSKPTSAAQSAAIVRGIQSYHVLSNGWNDIAYNFLVDPFGQIFVGRKGGAAKNVIGAHAQGFNTGSTGVAVLGTYEGGTISAKARTALTALLAWRLDVAHVDPASRLTWTSGGNPKFPAGTPVSLNAISGHRDTGSTSCPGAKLHGELGSLAAAARALGGPKIFNPRSTGALGGPVRFTATLSEARGWTVDVFDAVGNRVAGASGTTKALDWTWSSAGAPPGRYTYAIAAGEGVRAATGVVGGSEPPLELGALAPKPVVTTPNGDGVGDRQRIHFTLTRSATIEARLETPAGAPVATLVADRTLGPGARLVGWKGKDANGARVPDGRYVLVVEAASGPETVTKSAAVRVDRTLAHLSAAPTPFSPNGDGTLDTLAVGFELKRAASVDARVMAGSRRVATLRNGSLSLGKKSFVWDGRESGGSPAADRTYTVIVDATTASLGTRRLTAKVALDTTKPVTRILRARRVKRGTSLRLSVSEDVRLAIRLGGRTFNRSLARGTWTFRLPVRGTSVTVSSFDLAGNAGKPVSRRVT